MHNGTGREEERKVDEGLYDDCNYFGRGFCLIFMHSGAGFIDKLN